MSSLHTRKRTAAAAVAVLAAVPAIFAASSVITSGSASALDRSIIDKHVAAMGDMVNSGGADVKGPATPAYTIPEGYTTFTDANFYNCVANEFAWEFPDEEIPDTGLTNRQLSQITDLNCGILSGDSVMFGIFDKRAYIANTKGLEKMTGLLRLGLANVGDSIDLSHNTKLTSLLVASQKLASLDVSKNTKLMQLAVISQKLTSLDVSKNVELEMLDVVNGYIYMPNSNYEDIPDDIEELVNKGSLTELNVSNNKRLSTLAVWFSGLADIDVSHNSSLRELNIWFGNLTAVPDVSEIAREPILSLDYNSIFDFSSLEGFKGDENDAYIRLTANAQKKTVEVSSLTYELPPLFAQAKDDDWGWGIMYDEGGRWIDRGLYTERDFVLDNAVLSEDGKSITIEDKTKPATIKVVGGAADGSILTVVYTEGNYTLTFDANGGTNAPKAIASGPTTESSFTFTIPEDKPTRSGYTFLGWADKKDATSANADYAAGKKVTVTANKTLYAVWKADQKPDGSDSDSDSGIKAPDTGFTTDADNNSKELQNLIVALCVLAPIAAVTIYGIARIQARRKF